MWLNFLTETFKIDYYRILVRFLRLKFWVVWRNMSTDNQIICDHWTFAGFVKMTAKNNFLIRSNVIRFFETCKLTPLSFFINSPLIGNHSPLGFLFSASLSSTVATSDGLGKYIAIFSCWLDNYLAKHIWIRISYMLFYRFRFSVNWAISTALEILNWSDYGWYYF